MKKSNLLPSIVLGSICLVVAVLLSVLNIFTAPIIAERQSAAADAALLEVLPDGKNFEELTIDASYPTVVKKGWKADGGFVFQMEVTGYKSGLVIMCGVDSDGKITGVKHIASAETNGVEGDLNGKYNNMTLDSLETQLIAGSTLTSKAYADAVKAALQSAILAGGGDVDTRTPEQILQDECNAALGTTGLTFVRWFATEVLEGVTKTYVTENNGGFVFLIGETYVGVNSEGQIVNEGVSEEDAAVALQAFTLASNTTLTQITTFPSGVKKTIVKKIYKTATGNYVFELKMSDGYTTQYNEYNNPDAGPTPIMITVSITADGKIIDCITTEQYETDGLGSNCAEEWFRDSWIGAGKTDTDKITTTENQTSGSAPGLIAGATVTTNAYRTALNAAFAAVEKLVAQEGGND